MASTNVSLVLSFYERLFSTEPQFRSMFPIDIVEQAEKLEHTLDFALASLSNMDLVIEPLRDLGARHVGYGVQSAHYAVLTDVLTETLAEAWGPSWTREHDAAWRKLLTFITDRMIEGAECAAKAA